MLILLISQTLFFVWLSNSYTYSERMKQTDDTLVAFSSNVDHSIATTLEALVPKLKQVTYLAVEGNYHHDIVNDYVSFEPFVDGIAIMDSEGNVDNLTNMPMSLSRKERLSFVEFGKDVLSMKVINGEKLEILLSVGLSDDSVILVNINALNFFDNYQYLNDQLVTNYYYIIDVEGTILFHPKGEVIGLNMHTDEVAIKEILALNNKEYVELSRLFKLAAAKSSLSVSYKINGVEMYGRTSRLSSFPILTVAVIDYKTFLAGEVSKSFINLIPMLTTMMMGVIVFAMYTFDIKYTDYFTGTKNDAAFHKLMDLHFKRCPHKFYMMVFKIDSVLDREKGQAIFDQAIYVDISKHLKSYRPAYRELFRLSREHYAFVDCRENYSYENLRAIKSKVLQVFAGSMSKEIKLNGEFLMTSVDAKSYDTDGLIGNLIAYMETPEYKKHESKQMDYNEVVYALRKRKKAKALIEKAIEHKSVEIVFQPIFDIEKGFIDRHEVLMRIMENGQMMQPKQYIQLAEEEGKITALNALVVRKTFLYYSKVAYQNGVKLKLNINISGVDINQRFVDYIIRMKEKFKIDRNHITFELTETRSYEIGGEFVEQIERLKREGFMIAIDDFGTGFANIEQLSNLNVDYLKVDGSFIYDLHKSLDKQRLLRAILEIADVYEVDVVAEFVENQEILNILKSLDVKYAQGFYLGKPEEVPSFKV